MFRKILLLSLIGALIGAVFVYRIWTKPHEDIRKQKPSVNITATQLLASFSADYAAKDAELKDVVLVLEGIPSKINEAEEHHLISYDEGGDFTIQAYLPKNENNLKAMDEGQSIRLLCKYSGYLINDESFLIPADIKLEPCYILD